MKRFKQLMGVGTVQVATNANYRTYTQAPGGFAVTVYYIKGERNVQRCGGVCAQRSGK